MWSRVNFAIVAAAMMAVAMEVAAIGNGTNTLTPSSSPSASPTRSGSAWTPTISTTASNSDNSASLTFSHVITPPPTKTMLLTETGSASMSTTHQLTETEAVTESLSENVTVSASRATETATITETLTLSRSPTATKTFSRYTDPRMVIAPTVVSESELRGDGQNRDGRTNFTLFLVGDMWDLDIATVEFPRPTRSESLGEFFFNRVAFKNLAGGNDIKPHIFRLMWTPATCFVDGNETHVTLALKHEANYELGQKDPITAEITIDETCFRNRMRDLNATFQITYYPREPPFGADLMRVAEAVSLGTSIGNSVLAFNALSAFQVGRLSLLWDIHTCDFEPFGRPESLRHPFQDSLEDQRVEFQLGGCGFNTLFAIGGFVVLGLFAFFLGKLHGSHLSKKSLALAYFPSIWYAAALSYAHWTTAMCATTVAHTTHTATIGIACACLLFWMVVAISVPFAVSPLHFGAWYVRDPTVTALGKLWTGRGKWVDDELRDARHAGYTNMMGVLFNGFRSRRYWFTCVDVALSVTLALLSAWQPQLTDDCFRLGVAAATLHCAYLLAFAILRPFSAPFDNGIFAVLNMLQVTSYGLYLSRPGPVGVIADAGYILVLTCSFVPLLKTVVVICLRVVYVVEFLLCAPSGGDEDDELQLQLYRQRHAHAEAHMSRSSSAGDRSSKSVNPLLTVPNRPKRLDEGIFTDDDDNDGNTNDRGNGRLPSPDPRIPRRSPSSARMSNIGDSASVVASQLIKKKLRPPQRADMLPSSVSLTGDSAHPAPDEYAGMKIGEDVAGEPPPLAAIIARERLRLQQEKAMTNVL